jgi:2'-5' RNA ligase
LYVSVENDLIIKQLADEIKSRIKPLGFVKEEKQYTPHLTLARFKYISDKEYFQTIVNRYSKTKIQNVNVSEVVFYQSILGSKGPTYVPIQAVKLNSI